MGTHHARAGIPQRPRIASITVSSRPQDDAYTPPADIGQGGEWFLLGS
ncbi:hypothetical protein [Kibdelosporangium philippinense]